VEFFEDAEYITTDQGMTLFCPTGLCTPDQWSANMGADATLVTDDTSTDYSIFLPVTVAGWRSICWTPPNDVAVWTTAEVRLESRGTYTGNGICGTYQVDVGHAPNQRSWTVIPQTEQPSGDYTFTIWAPIDPPVGGAPLCVTAHNGSPAGADCAPALGIHAFKLWLKVGGQLVE
jgi:hypothetical protein